SPKVINNMPITNTPTQEVKSRTKKLTNVSAAPNIMRPGLVYRVCSSHLIRGISKIKIKKPFNPNSNPISNSESLCTSLYYNGMVEKYCRKIIPNNVIEAKNIQKALSL